MHRERNPQSVTGIVAGPVLVLSVDVFLERIAKCQLTARLKQIHQSVSKNQSHRGLSLSRRGLRKIRLVGVVQCQGRDSASWTNLGILLLLLLVDFSIFIRQKRAYKHDFMFASQS